MNSVFKIFQCVRRKNPVYPGNISKRRNFGTATKICNENLFQKFENFHFFEAVIQGNAILRKLLQLLVIYQNHHQLYLGSIRTLWKWMKYLGNLQKVDGVCGIIRFEQYLMNNYQAGKSQIILLEALRPGRFQMVLIFSYIILQKLIEN